MRCLEEIILINETAAELDLYDMPERLALCPTHQRLMRDKLKYFEEPTPLEKVIGEKIIDKLFSGLDTVTMSGDGTS